MEGFDLSTISDAYVGGTPVSAIYYSTTTYDQPTLIWPLTTPSEYANQYFTIESLEDNNEITLGWYNEYASQGRVLYWARITNGTIGTWQPRGITGSQGLLTSLNRGDKIVLKANYSDWCRSSIYSPIYTIPQDVSRDSGCHLDSSKTVKIYGNISSLISGEPEIRTYKDNVLFYKFFCGLKLVDASNLYINVKLSKYSFFQAFYYCSYLVYAPSILYSERMFAGCYMSMFEGCSLLKFPPALPSTRQLATECYTAMFKDCVSLEFGPELPSKKLNTWCYDRMFYGCTSLKVAPTLPADDLYDGCYDRMFYGCTSLEVAPILPIRHASSLYGSCRRMFMNCHSLNKIICLYDATNYYNNYSTVMEDWVSGVAPTGTFVKLDNANWPVDSTSGIPQGWTVVQASNDIAKPLTITSYVDNNEIYITNTTNDFAYSLDGLAWHTLQPDTRITINNGDSMLLASTSIVGTTINYTVNSTWGIGNIKATGSFSVSGNIMSLIGNRALFYYAVEIPKANTFSRLFYGNTYLVSAANLLLPATTLTESCYDQMFYNCTSLTTAPELPATILAESCYEAMFYGCTSLTTAPSKIPALVLKEFCCYEMFGECTSLTTAPVLPATTLADYCYQQMFYNCTSLTTAPELPATTLASTCYYCMFLNCSSLNSITCLATDISADLCTTAWVNGVAANGTFTKNTIMQNWPTGYNGIPSGWTVQNTGISYFTIESTSNNNDISYMSSENNIFEYSINNGSTWVTWAPNTDVTLNNGDKLLVKGNNPTVNYGLANAGRDGIASFEATGTFDVSGNIMSLVYGDNYEGQTVITNNFQFACLFLNNSYLINAQNLVLPATTLAPSCYAYMFQGCTSLITAPELTTKSLSSYCYQFMFNGCTSLTTAPELPAIVLREGCYKNMFQGCTSLNNITCLATIISATDCTSYWVNGVSATGTFVKDANTTWTTGNSGIPSGWTVQNAS